MVLLKVEMIQGSVLLWSAEVVSPLSYVPVNCVAVKAGIGEDPEL